MRHPFRFGVDVDPDHVGARHGLGGSDDEPCLGRSCPGSVDNRSRWFVDLVGDLVGGCDIAEPTSGAGDAVGHDDGMLPFSLEFIGDAPQYLVPIVTNRALVQRGAEQPGEQGVATK